MASKMLYIIHNPAWTGCRVADVARSRGYEVEFLCPPAGEALPPDMTGYAGLMVGGSEKGHAGKPELHRWVADEIAFIRTAVEAGTPTLGICMGAQLLAAAFGGQVAARPDSFCELGFYPVEPTEQGRELFDGTSHFYQAHFEGIVALPEGAVLLARGDRFPVQAFRIGERAYGVQFHPDAKLDSLTRESLESDSMRHLPGAQSTDDQLVAAPRHEPAVQAWTERFVDRWLGRAERLTAA